MDVWYLPLADVPQWSPPTSGGSTALVTEAEIRDVVPQWSPPTSGGSTARAGRADRADPGAAMEPADERREHLRGRHPRPGWRRRPQWSPPTSGGSTASYEVRAVGKDGPQWSPPTSGGSTLYRGRHAYRLPSAAMEPADERREHSTIETRRKAAAWPQWSPPTSGGSTAP